MDNFNNKIKFISGDKAIEKIPYEFEKYNCFNITVFIENRGRRKAILRLIKKAFKNNRINFEICKDKILSDKNVDIDYFSDCIKANKDKGILAIGGAEFVNKILTAKTAIERRAEDFSDIGNIANIAIPTVAMPLDTVDTNFASKNTVINIDGKPTIIKINGYDNVTVMCDKRLLCKNIKILKNQINSYICGVYKALIAVVGNSNLLAMPSNKAVIINIIDNLLKIKENPRNIEYYLKAEAAKLFIPLGEESYKYNALSQIINILYDDEKQREMIFIAAAGRYIINFKENCVFNEMLKTVIKKYKINSAKVIQESVCDFIDGLNIELNADALNIAPLIDKQKLTAAYECVKNQSVSDEKTLEYAYKALTDLCKDRAY